MMAIIGAFLLQCAQLQPLPVATHTMVVRLSVAVAVLLLLLPAAQSIHQQQQQQQQASSTCGRLSSVHPWAGALGSMPPPSPPLSPPPIHQVRLRRPNHRGQGQTRCPHAHKHHARNACTFYGITAQQVLAVARKLVEEGFAAAGYTLVAPSPAISSACVHCTHSPVPPAPHCSLAHSLHWNRFVNLDDA